MTIPSSEKKYTAITVEILRDRELSKLPPNKIEIRVWKTIEERDDVKHVI